MRLIISHQPGIFLPILANSILAIWAHLRFNLTDRPFSAAARVPAAMRARTITSLTITRALAARGRGRAPILAYLGLTLLLTSP